MNNQRGFLSPTLYAAIGAAVVIGGLWIWGSVQTKRLEACKQEYAGFQAQVKALGEVAEAKARTKEKADLALKRRIDNENKSLRANLAAESKRVRDFNTLSGGLSGLPTNTERPDFACFSRAELDSAIRQYQSELLTIAEKGAQATLDLDTAKTWVKDQVK